MTHQDDLQPAEMPEDQPAMELLDGAEEATPAKRSTMGRLVRGGLYSVLLLSASALLAISAVPELANYATFIPDSRANSSCSSQTACTALSVASLEGVEGSPCCPLEAAKAALADGCSRSCDGESAEVTLASLAERLSGGCQKGSCCSDSCEDAVLAAVEDEAPVEQLLSDEQLALLPAGEDLD